MDDLIWSGEFPSNRRSVTSRELGTIPRGQGGWVGAAVFFHIKPVGQCAAPGLANADFSLYKNFKATERVGIQLRFEFFDLFNKVQFRTDQGLFGSSLASGAYGCTTNNVVKFSTL